jgi:hypothetical protein
MATKRRRRRGLAGLGRVMTAKQCRLAANRVEKLLDQGQKAAARALYHKAAAAGCAAGGFGGVHGRKTGRRKRGSKRR